MVAAVVVGNLCGCSSHFAADLTEFLRFFAVLAAVAERASGDGQPSSASLSQGERWCVLLLEPLGRVPRAVPILVILCFAHFVREYADYYDDNDDCCTLFSCFIAAYSGL